MKSLEELAIKHGLITAHPKHIKDLPRDHMMKLVRAEILTQLESLINEVISQRLGEPIAEVVLEKFADFMPPQPNLKWHQPNHEIGTKLYALNIES